jgi:ABC-type sugar transport system substrate-binding protein
MRHHPKRKILYLLCILTAVLVAAGCGSAASSTDNAGAAKADIGVSATELAKAEQVVANDERAPSGVGVTQPLQKPPPRGKTIGLIFSGSSVPPEDLIGLQAATSLVGWHYKLFGTGTTADNFQAAFAAAMASKLSAVWVSSIDPKLWAQYGEEWNAQGIPVIDEGTPWPNSGSDFNYFPATIAGQDYSQLMDWIAVDSKGARVTVLIDDMPEIEVIHTSVLAMKARMLALCPTCTVDILTTNVADIGSTLPQEVVSALLKSPSTTYFVSLSTSFMQGVVPAIENAGLGSKVKVLVGSGGLPEQAELKAGNNPLAADLAFSTYYQGFICVDFAIRVMEHASTSPDYNWRYVTRIFTPSNISNFGQPVTQYWTGLPDSAALWAKLWDVL